MVTSGEGRQLTKLNFLAGNLDDINVVPRIEQKSYTSKHSHDTYLRGSAIANVLFGSDFNIEKEMYKLSSSLIFSHPALTPPHRLHSHI